MEDVFAQACQILLKAMEMSPTEREAFLSQVRQSQPNIAFHLDELLANRTTPDARSESHGTSINPSVCPVSPAQPLGPRNYQKGDWIGAYQLLSHIGDGGMG